jgi:uncharacterized protein YjbI with pentapeptide repeats
VANDEHLKILRRGVKEWNKWRDNNPESLPYLVKANLSKANLSKARFSWGVIDAIQEDYVDSRADLSRANLSRSDLSDAYLEYVTLSHADLSFAKLRKAYLRKAYLSGANLSYADLSGADLSETDLSDANLSCAKLKGVDLNHANLKGANLSEAKLGRVDLSYADLSETDLSEADLSDANLRSVLLINAKLRLATLEGADLHYSNLSGADLSGATLNHVNFGGARLRNALLINAHLPFANLCGANLSGADLSGALLEGATLVGTNLCGASLAYCGIYGASAWDIELDGRTNQQNLCISPSGTPPTAHIMVDNLKLAQFVYLLLDSEEIRDVIDTITSRAVLILGRFSKERKCVLDAIRDELRKSEYKYLPIVFDFQPAANQTTIETIKTLAGMARFVIADITDARSVLQELQAIVTETPSVAVRLLIRKSEHKYGMLDYIRRYRSVVEKIYEYENAEEVISSIKENIIGPAEAKVKELRRHD